MLTNDQIYRALREVAIATHHDFNLEDIHHVETNKRSYDESQLNEFERDLIEAGNKIRVLFLEYHLDDASFKDFIKGESSPILAFIKGNDRIKPILLIPEKKGYYQIIIDETNNYKSNVTIGDLDLIHDATSQIHFFAIFNPQCVIFASL